MQGDGCVTEMLQLAKQAARVLKNNLKNSIARKRERRWGKQKKKREGFLLHFRWWDASDSGRAHTSLRWLAGDGREAVSGTYAEVNLRGMLKPLKGKDANLW